jgi:hypothetical protein
MLHFHLPVEGIAHGINSVINLWRDRRAVDQACLFSDPVMARRDRIWRRVLAVIITLGFLMMLALPVWLFIKAFGIPPPTPEQIQQRRAMMMRRAAGTNAPPAPAIPQSSK